MLRGKHQTTGKVNEALKEDERISRDETTECWSRF